MNLNTRAYVRQWRESSVARPCQASRYPFLSSEMAAISEALSDLPITGRRWSRLRAAAVLAEQNEHIWIHLIPVLPMVRPEVSIHPDSGAASILNLLRETGFDRDALLRLRRPGVTR